MLIKKSFVDMSEHPSGHSISASAPPESWWGGGTRESETGEVGLRPGSAAGLGLGAFLPLRRHSRGDGARSQGRGLRL